MYDSSHHHQAPPSVEFSRQEYWSGFSPPGDLPDPGTEPVSPALQADIFTVWGTKEAPTSIKKKKKELSLHKVFNLFQMFTLYVVNK